MNKIIVDSENEFVRKATDFSENLSGGDVVFLKGNLGAGKTTFVKAVAKSFGVEKVVNSPTFPILKTYDIKVNNIKRLNHLDLYRIESEKDLVDLDLKTILEDRFAVTFIEWPEIAQSFDKYATYIVNFFHDNTKRFLTIQKTKDNVKNAVKLFKRGKIGIFPTDTAYGIGCRCDVEESIDRIFKIRKRDKEKPLLILVSGFDMVSDYIDKSSLPLLKIAERYWPGGITFIFKANTKKISPTIRGGNDTIAIRIPDNKLLIDIISSLNVPIVAPSANLQGETTPFNLQDVDFKILENVDFLIDGKCKIKNVSTIVDLTVNPYKVLREGGVEFKI